MEIDAWIRAHVEPAGPPELVHDRPWGSVWRVPTADGPVWLKACAPALAFEARLTACLAARHPTLLPQVLAHDDDRGRLLLGDLGAPFGVGGIPLDAYLELLPRYAELQQAEAAHAGDHLAHGVPDRRLDLLPDRFDELVDASLPLEPGELAQLRAFAPGFRELCGELDTYGVAATIQHDDLHGNNLYPGAGGTRILDWGDSSVAHPFFSLIQAFRHVPAAWHEPMQGAYAAPWGEAAACAALAVRVGWTAYAVALLDERAVHPPANRVAFDETLASVLREAIAMSPESRR